MLGEVWLTNRMVLAVARQIRELFAALGTEALAEANDPLDLPNGPIDLLIVGRQHLTDNGYRYGHEIVAQAVAKARPATLVYVVPSAWAKATYAPDRVALEAVKNETQVLILEIGALSDATNDEAVQKMRTLLESPETGDVLEVF